VQLAGLDRVALVGSHDAYHFLELSTLVDRPNARGPIAGLAALFDQAKLDEVGHVIALACDMPYVTAGLIGRLACEDPEAIALVPKRERFEPLCARYDVARASPHLDRMVIEGTFALHGLLDALGDGCRTLQLSEEEAMELRDWDCLDDIE
jgi:molybdopterin-guanine dinucleotide biosynthesis protein A